MSFTTFKLRLLLFCIFASSSLILTQESSDNKEAISKTNECRRCKLITDSFSHWFDKTSRGKHEGGDAAWEKAKLKSYARSEMRLVEIQESLCSELDKDQAECYNFLEEADQHLEKWWVNENQNPLDLYNWLCIDNFKYCCPANHFGKKCEHCPQDKNNKICGGRGKCNGDGTRTGDGTCKCKKGYKGLSCEKCDDNYFKVNQTCKPCHPACVGCYGEGVNSCMKCATGWIKESRVCVDLNECLDITICKDSEYCLNKDGHYLCNPCDKKCKTCEGSGPYNCTSCHRKHILLMGSCLNMEFKLELLNDTYERIGYIFAFGMYSTIFVLPFYVYKKSKLLASFIVLCIYSVYYNIKLKMF